LLFVARDKQIVPSSDKEYRLADQNCIDFIAAVAQSIGYPIPARSSTQNPVQFLNDLRVVIEYENKARAADRKAKEAQEAAKAAQEDAATARENAKLDREKAKAADEKAKATEDILRNSIPAGWLPCTCPEKHRDLGKIVNEVLYHPSNIRCP
jgi:hypothetical protein